MDIMILDICSLSVSLPLLRLLLPLFFILILFVCDVHAILFLIGKYSSRINNQPLSDLSWSNIKKH